MTMIPSPGRRPQSGTNNPLPGLGLYPIELSRNLKCDSVARLQPTPPRAIDATEPVSAAVEAMRTGNVGCLLVTRGGKLAGIFTERDLLEKAALRSLDFRSERVADYMTPDPHRKEWVDDESGGEG
jgi:CBS domain-containing protein